MASNLNVTSTLSFRVEKGVISIATYMGWMTRPSIMTTMFKLYIDRKGLTNLPLINIDLSDTASDIENYPHIPYFTISATPENFHKLIPDPYSLCWPEANINSVFEKCHQIEIAGSNPPSDPRAFWVGQNSHWTRKILVEVSKRHPDKIVARFLEWENNVIPEEKMTTLEGHTHYKYLIDLSGQGFSARIKYLLFSKRPLFIVDRKYHDWISCELIPWVHFIPVAEDDLENDLLRKLEWAEQNYERAQGIAKDALQHIRTKLTMDNIFNKISTALQYSS
jgi:hypothetical protein